MKTIEVNLTNTFNEIEILSLADLHLGDPNCDIAKAQEYINYIKDTPNCYTVLNGDIINNAIKDSVSDIYGEVSPMRQLEFAVNLLTPIKDKILCITSGNHEDRTYKTDGIDLTKILACELGIKNRYSSESVVLFLSFGTAKDKFKNTNTHKHSSVGNYVLYITHGTGGGKREGGKINSLADMASIVDADVYIHSHTHLPAIIKEAFYRLNRSGKSVILVDKLFINTSSTLNYGGYGEKYGFKPNSKDTPHIYLNGTKRKMEAKL